MSGAAAKRDGATLLADIGGTNARFALAAPQAAMPLMADSVRQYAVADFPSLAETAKRYLLETGAQPRQGVFAVAGPVTGDEVHITNHPWTISVAGTRDALTLETLRVVNDFAAMSMCLPLLEGGQVETFGAPATPNIDAARAQTYAVLGPGTGLGVGALLVRDGRASVLETEGGHLSFAPFTDEEIEILRRLHRRFGRVSYERLISGQGLIHLYQTLCEIDAVQPADLQPKDIRERAAAGDAQAARAVESLCAILGAVAGDFVFAFGAWDGVYLAGGMVPRLLPWLRRGEFRRRFEGKGRFASRMADVPAVAILHPQAGLLGAAALAVVEAGGSPLRAAGDQTSHPTRAAAEGSR